MAGLFDSPEVKGIKTLRRAHAGAGRRLFDSPEVKGIKTGFPRWAGDQTWRLFDSPEVKGIKTTPHRGCSRSGRVYSTAPK